MRSATSRTDHTARQFRARRINEQTWSALAGLRAELLDVRCECGRAGCNATLTLGYEIFRSIRLQGGWFVVAKGHARKREKVVRRKEDFVIVTRASSSAPTLPFDEI